MITIRTNLPEFKAKLKTISKDFEKKAVRSANRAAAAVFQKIAKAEAPIRNPRQRKYVSGALIPPGVLKASIGVVTKKAKPGTVLNMVIPRSGRRTRKGKSSVASRDAYYWAWVEQGHVIAPGRKRIAGGTRRRALERTRLKAAGRMTKANPYLRRAFTKGQGRAVDAFYAQLDKAFKKYSAL